MKSLRIVVLSIFLTLLCSSMMSQDLMTNIYGRTYQSLNGKWDAIIDLYDQGGKNEIFKNRKAENKTDFYEYSFENGLRLNVPSDWNSQLPELKYYEGTIWYARRFDAKVETNKRLFLYFRAVSYRCNIYLNGKKVGSHEEGFTPFQIEVTDLLKSKDNFLAVEVNNTREIEAIPAMAFDWWNYGGITRDVMLVTTAETYIKDYFIQLDKVKSNQIDVSIQLSEQVGNKAILVEVPELKVK